MKRVLFHEDQLSAQLEKNGFAVFDLLSGAEISELAQIFAENHTESPSGFYATTHLEDKNKRREFSDRVIAILTKLIEPKFQNIHLLGGAFISKAPGEKGILPLHQDWNIVDEKVARSYNLWIPLVDVNETNGAIRILPGSHSKQETFRGPNVPPVLYPISKEVDKHMVSLNMKRGEAVLYDHALWHSSPANQTNELRLAFVLGVVPENVELKYYQQVENEVHEFESHPNFFFENDRNAGPKGLKFLRSFIHPNTFLSSEEFEQIYLGKQKEIKKSGFFARLFKK